MRYIKELRSKLKDLSKVDVLLFASVGGHLDQLLDLSDTYEDLDYLIVTNDVPPSRPILRNNTLQITHGERDLKQFLNLFECLLIILYTRPKVILSTGSTQAVWFSFFGKILGAKVIFIESMARVSSLSLTGKIVKYIANDFYVQWPELAKKTNAKYSGIIKRG